MIAGKLILMVSYFYLKKNETNILEITFLFGVFIWSLLYLYNWISFNTFFSMFMPVLVISMFLPKVHKAHQILMTDGLVAITFIILAVFWIIQEEIPYLNMLITNEQMVVYSSFLYAYLTYKNLKSNSNIFKYQRIPYITVEGTSSDNGDIYFSVKNSSDYVAKNVIIYFECVGNSYQDNSLNAINLFCRRKIEEFICFVKFQRSKPTYETLVKLNRLEPNSSTNIPLNDFVTNQLKIRNLKAKQAKFDIIANWTFISIDNLLSDGPTYKKFQFERFKDRFRLIKTSNEPITIY